jgi:hypothetical protein
MLLSVNIRLISKIRVTKVGTEFQPASVKSGSNFIADRITFGAKFNYVSFS